jgi:hypothetical protein
MAGTGRGEQASVDHSVPRAPLAVPLVISSLAHGLLLALLFLGARFSWPAPPIPIEVKPMHRAAKPAAPVEKHDDGKGKQETAEAVKPGAGATHKKPKPKVPPAPPAPPPPATTNLAPFAPDDAHVVVLLRMDKLRASPHRAGTETLLAAMPDWDTLVAGSGVSPLDDFDALLIATADPRDATATFLAARHADTPKLRALTARTLPPGDPRVFRTLGPGLTVLTQPEAARKLESNAVDMGVDAQRGWLRQLEQFDRVAQAADGPALLLTVPDVPSLLSFGSELPTPLALALATTAEASPSLHAQLVFANDKEAQRFAAAWPEILARYRTATALLGLSTALDGLKLTTHDATLELVGQIPEAQMRLALNFAKALLPPRPHHNVDMR